MKVLSISHSAVVGGYHDRYREVVRQGGVDLTLLTPERWRQFNRTVELEKKSDPEYRIIARQPATWGLPGHGLKNVSHVYLGIAGLIAEVRPEIIELWEEPFSAVTAHTIRAARRTVPRAKLIFFSAQNIRKSYPPPFSWFEKYTYRHADFAFIMNKEAEEVVRKKGWRKGSLVLPLGVNTERFQKLSVSSLRANLGLDRFTVGFVGKLEVQKGVSDLVQAVGKLKDEVNLLIIGGGTLKKRLNDLIEELGLSERTRIVPSVPYDELPNYFNCMDALVLPSVTLPGLKEQFGRVLIEAMACEVPVIGSDSGEIPDVIGDAGLIFEEGNSDALSERITLLISNPNRVRELARKGRQRVEDKYAWSVIACQQIRVYNKLLFISPPPPSSLR